jgi:hypothetical protein
MSSQTGANALISASLALLVATGGAVGAAVDATVPPTVGTTVGTTAPRQDVPPADRSAAATTLAGCIVDEAAFAQMTGLGSRAAAGDQGAQLVLVDRAAGDAARGAYALTGTRERELLEHMHARVEVTGTVEGVSRVPSNVQPVQPDATLPSGATGVTPQGSPAHEPSDAVHPHPDATTTDATAATAAAAAVQPSSAPSALIGVGDLPRLNVVSFRVIGGPCGSRPPNVASRETEGAVPSPVPRAQRPDAPDLQPASSTEFPRGPVTVVGCLLRQPAGEGRAADAAARPSDSFIMTRAAMVGAAVFADARSAVPGSLPAGSGSGTVRASRPADRVTEATLAFVLEGATPELAALAGKGVSIVGTIRATEERATDRPSAHSTAPTGTLVVESFKADDGGVCR